MEAQPARLVPRHVLHGLGVGPVPLGVGRAGLVGPPRLEPTRHPHDFSEPPGPDQRRPPDPRPEQRTPKDRSDIVGEDRFVVRRRPSPSVLADDRHQPGRQRHRAPSRAALPHAVRQQLIASNHEALDALVS